MKPEEAVECALARFAPLKLGATPMSYEALKKRFGWDPGTIEDGIRRAFKEGWVELVSNHPPLINRNEKLEIEVRKKFSTRTVIVVESGEPPESKGRTGLHEHQSADTWKMFDDEIHRRVGYAMAAQFGQLSFPDGTRIGLGSGRGVFYTVEAVTRLRPEFRVRAREAHLVPLTGAVHARDYTNQVNARMDADFHVGMFAPCVENTATLHLVNYPISAVQYREFTCLGVQQWGKCCPTHAVVGIGVLAEGHRFVVQAERNRLAGQKNSSKKLDAVYTPIIGVLTDLVENCQDVYETYKYYPVADICNHLIFIKNDKVPPGVREKIVRQIKNVNSLLLNVDSAQLQQIPQLMIVAAGERKAYALQQILISPEYRVEMICIDRTLAEQLITIG